MCTNKMRKCGKLLVKTKPFSPIHTKLENINHPPQTCYAQTDVQCLYVDTKRHTAVTYR